MRILVLNAGSSSQKSSLYELSDDALPDQSQPLWEAQIDWPQGMAEFKVKTLQGAVYRETLPSQGRSLDTLHLLNTLWQGDTKVLEKLNHIHVIGHRVVHGGQIYRRSTWINASVKAEIDRLSQFAPVHNPINLAGITTIEQILGDIPQVAVFDTAFHAQLPAAASVYPIPYVWLEQGVRRYGFHGISHQYCAQKAAQVLNRDLQDLRLISCHLGNGCSLAAIRHGHSVDTTMGFTPLEGLMMGSRSGSIDPGLILYLLRQHYTVDQLDRVLNQESGLLGISGLSNDMRQITAAAAEGQERAQLALEIYIHRLRAEMGAMLVSLDGLDALVFTAGVGENSALIRAAACEAFSCLGVQIDPAKNEASPVDQDIATEDSAVRILVIHAQEAWAIAQECWQLITR